MTDDDRAELRRLWELYKDDLPWELSPVKKPPDRFGHVPPHVRQWLVGLSADDITVLKVIVPFYRNAKTIKKFLQVVGLAAMGALGAGAAFGDHIMSFFKGLFGK